MKAKIQTALLVSVLLISAPIKGEEAVSEKKALYKAASEMLFEAKACEAKGDSISAFMNYYYADEACKRLITTYGSPTAEKKAEYIENKLSKLGETEIIQGLKGKGVLDQNLTDLKTRQDRQLQRDRQNRQEKQRLQQQQMERQRRQYEQWKRDQKARKQREQQRREDQRRRREAQLRQLKNN